MNVFKVNDKRFNLGIELLNEGKGFIFDNVDFWLDKDNKTLEIRVESSWKTKITEQTAMADIQRGINLFNYLVESSSDFAKIAKENSSRFSLISDDGMGAVEICYLSDGKIIWHP